MCLFKVVRGTLLLIAFLLTFLETRELRCQSLGIEFHLFVAGQFFIYSLHSQFEFPSQEYLFS